MDKIKKQLNPGRPRNPENVGKLEVPQVKAHNSELPKEIIGSHMGVMHPVGPAIKSPVKLPKADKKAPPL